MATKTITDDSFQQDVLGSAKPVLVDFWASWCAPCLRIAPALEEISDDLEARVTIAKLNIEENPEIPARYGVRNIPTMILFKNGEPAATQVGAGLKSQLQAWLEGQL
jgi:thioredoxin 1